MSIEVKSKYITIRVDIEKIQKAFGELCDDAHGNSAGLARDALYLSYHQCKDTPELQRAQSLIKTLEMAEEEGCIHADEPFSLQAEYDAFFERWEEEQKPTRDLLNRPDPYGTEGQRERK